MSALDELMYRSTESYTALEAAVVFLSGKHSKDAEKAAAELARLRAIEAAALPVVADVYRMMQLIGGTLDERKHVEALAAALEAK